MQLKRHGFSLVALISALAILAVLIAILYPCIVSARRRASDSACLSNLRQISHAVTLYTVDYDGHYPPVDTGFFIDSTESNGHTWATILLPYVGQSTMLRCPEVQVPARMAAVLKKMNNI